MFDVWQCDPFSPIPDSSEAGLRLNTFGLDMVQ